MRKTLIISLSLHCLLLFELMAPRVSVVANYNSGMYMVSLGNQINPVKERSGPAIGKELGKSGTIKSAVNNKFENRKGGVDILEELGVLDLALLLNANQFENWDECANVVFHINPGKNRLGRVGAKGIGGSKCAVRINNELINRISEYRKSGYRFFDQDIAFFVD